ncbi:dimethyladenosine transferase 2, mitochondrial [Nilaparvata lugens]|uniref:dimethyladenosine transferase 2, mitochondrial n=1 Tax=Nilaparvata lugens TaxID=108931 RepID=UPI00193D4585|nr:dimethyladenosine transferase 2, mitochondrial [Nilaparvata lugens]XP_039281445.1 dimethyladenosine transferase 2, mitochondrial [Nilaparvata lugens]
MFRFYSKYFYSNNISFRNLCLVTSRKFLHSCSEHKIGDDIANSTVIDGKNTRSNSVITETGDFDPSENDFKTIKKKNKTALNKATSELINSRESLRKMKDLFKRSFEDQARNGPSYLCDEIVARNVCESIKRNMTSTDLPVLECNPGAGFLTKELIDAGINNLQLFEPNSIFFSYLTEKFPGLQIHKKNVSKLWKLLYLDGIDGGTRTADVFSGIKARSWDEDPSYCLIAAIDGTSFVKSFIIGTMVQENMYQCGKPEFYLILDPLSYATLTNRGDLGNRIYTPLSVHFQNTFNTELLLKIPRNAFLPVKKLKINKKSSHCIQLAKEEGDLLYLIKVTGRPELARLRDLDQMSAFYNFVSQVFNVRTNRLIPFLEQWIPGCGPKLIAKGYTVYTLTGELKPEEAYSIFMDICLPYDDGLTFSSGLGNLTLKKPSNEDLEEYDDP